MLDTINLITQHFALTGFWVSWTGFLAQSFDIHKERIELFLEYNFSLPQISEILGVSLSTVNRRLKDYGLSVTQIYSTISATELVATGEWLVSCEPEVYMYNKYV